MTAANWPRLGLAALRETLDVDGQTRRAMIEYLYAEGFWDARRLSWDAAVARWNDCLNPQKPAFFKLGEVWALMRHFGRHQLLLTLADDLGYEVRRKPTEERRQDLLEHLTDVLERTERELVAAREALAGLDGDAGGPADDGTVAGGF